MNYIHFFIRFSWTRTRLLLVWGGGLEAGCWKRSFECIDRRDASATLWRRGLNRDGFVLSAPDRRGHSGVVWRAHRHPTAATGRHVVLVYEKGWLSSLSSIDPTPLVADGWTEHFDYVITEFVVGTPPFSHLHSLRFSLKTPPARKEFHWCTGLAVEKLFNSSLFYRIVKLGHTHK